jgi:hypothetical protein
MYNFIFIHTNEKWEPGQLSGIMLGYSLDDGRFKSQQGLEIVFTTVSRLTLRPIQPPIQGVPGALSLEVSWGVKLPSHLHPVPRSIMHGDTPPLPNTPSWCDAQLKHRDNFIS